MGEERSELTTDAVDGIDREIPDNRNSHMIQFDTSLKGRAYVPEYPMSVKICMTRPLNRKFYAI